MALLDHKHAMMDPLLIMEGTHTRIHVQFLQFYGSESVRSGTVTRTVRTGLHNIIFLSPTGTGVVRTFS